VAELRQQIPQVQILQQFLYLLWAVDTEGIEEIGLVAQVVLEAVAVVIIQEQQTKAVQELLVKEEMAVLVMMPLTIKVVAVVALAQ
jgi:hypothetical protein